MNIEELEALRKTARNRILFGMLASVVAGVVLLAVTKMIPLAAIVLFGGGVVSALIGNKASAAFKKAFKDTFVLRSLQKTFDNLVYEPERGLAESVIASTNMMRMGDRYSSNDLISGSYKGVNFVQADVHIEEEHQSTDSDGHTTTTWVTLFLGRWMVFDFNKSFKANVQVSQKGFGNSKISNWGAKTKFKRVKMEDELFNKSFRIFAQEEHDAFYILTPSLMERIKRLADGVSGKLLLCFIDDKLHVAVHNNKDSFEHSIFRKIDEEKVLDSISQDIKLITGFIEELNLDNDLFKKEM